MKFLNGNIIYEFNVSHDESVSSFAPPATDPSSEEFVIDFRLREFHAPSRFPLIELQRSLRLPRAESETSAIPLMADLLKEFDISEQTQADMALHFKFHIDRLSRRSFLRNGIVPVKVSLDVKVISVERAAEIQRIMEDGRRRENLREMVAVEDTVAPAKKAVVEELERERVSSEGDEGECAICLESFGVGVEVIRMPCSHVYHQDCILRWLERTHFCPFCRFKLPS